MASRGLHVACASQWAKGEVTPLCLWTQNNIYLRNQVTISAIIYFSNHISLYLAARSAGCWANNESGAAVIRPMLKQMGKYLGTLSNGLN